jgi:hypothetical protein
MYSVAIALTSRHIAILGPSTPGHRTADPGRRYSTG